jgi:exonuclease SbcC
VRPLRLSVAAFGPFSSSQIIDFGTLGESPLFLINGPTGSGKTTILDAICFALYGKTTGNEREGHQMRCDQADPTILTEVTFEFELADKHYRIRRVPEQQRPRVKGEGFTMHKPEAQLHQVGGAGKEQLIVARKTADATKKIQELTGLTAEQFSQVMVLPQGKFRQLLLAESKDREQILSRLFETHLYQKIEEQLKARAKGIAGEAGQLEHKQAALLGTTSVDSQEELERQIALRKERLSELKTGFERLEKENQSAQRQLNEGQKLEADFILYDEAKMAVAALLAEESEQTSKIEQLKQAQVAEQLAPMEQDKRRCADELAIILLADKKNSEAVNCEASAVKKAEINWSAQEKKKPRLEQIKKNRQNLEALLPRFEALKQAENEYKIVEQRLAESNEQLARKAERYQQSEMQFKQAEAALKEAKDKVSRLPAEEANLIEQGRQLTLKRTLDAQQSTLNSITDELESTSLDLAQNKAASEQSKLERKSLELAWHAGQAALLANELKVGKPCPVCGSEEHPFPAGSEQPLPTENELKGAVELADKCAEEVRLLLNRQHGLEVKKEQVIFKIDELLSELGENAASSIAALKAGLEATSQYVNKLRKCNESLAAQEEKLLAMEKAVEEIKAAIVLATEQRDSVAREQAAAQQNSKNKQAELPGQQNSADSIEAEISSAIKEQMALSDAIEKADREHREAREALGRAEAGALVTKEQLKKAETANHRAEAAWTEKLLATTFENEAAYTKAKQPIEVVEQLGESIKVYKDQKLATETMLKERGQRVEGKTVPELDRLKLQAGGAAEKVKEASAEFHQQQAEHKQLIEAEEKLNEVALQLNKLNEEYKVIGHLSAVANGQNPHNLSLQRFVLSVLLDDVLIAATQRLLIMSKGRYQLIRKTEVTHGGRKAGLDLDVEDQYTGKTRPVSTLSGGESFMAALSLALGLSDVVQSYSGGIKLDMLFIDEGFGSLDSDSLELAIRTLVDLQSVGRMVGVISHVSELKERITTRIDLVASAGGSAIKIVAPSLD